MKNEFENLVVKKKAQNIIETEKDGEKETYNLVLENDNGVKIVITTDTEITAKINEKCDVKLSSPQKRLTDEKE
jgi:rRNA-processing protein FCF1